MQNSTRHRRDWIVLVCRAIYDLSRIVQSEIGLFETALSAGRPDRLFSDQLAAAAVIICSTICSLEGFDSFLHWGSDGAGTEVNN